MDTVILVEESMDFVGLFDAMEGKRAASVNAEVIVTQVPSVLPI